MASNYEAAFDLFEREQYAKALAVVKQAVQEKPESTDAWILLSRVLGPLERREERLQAANRAVALDPSNPLAINEKAKALLQLRRVNEAQEVCKHALELDPQCARAHITKAQILAVTGRPDAAFDELAVAQNVEVTLDAVTTEVNLLLLLGRIEEATLAGMSATTLFPKSSYAHSVYAMVCIKDDQYGEALEEADEALSLSSENGFAWAARGWALGGLGRYEESVVAFDRALQLEPDNDGYLAGRQESVRCRDLGKQRRRWPFR